MTLRVALECSLAPERALLAVRGQPWPFALTGRWAGGGAIVGWAPRELLGPRDPFDVLDEVPAPRGDARVGGGWFGWLGYGLGARVEALPPQPPRPVPMPAAHLAFYESVLRLDADGQWWFESLGGDAGLDEARALLATAPGEVAPQPATFELRTAGHVAAVREGIERIAAGEIFQANLCLRLEAGWDGDVAALFATAAPLLQPAYGACFVTPWGGVASLSPELFLRRTGREVRTGPIKGTAPRTSDPALLLASAKDRAEHVMIVDLMRNDLGRVSEYGSVEARAPEIQAHPGVWHLVSDVRGRLAPGRGDADLLRATFPPGSVTGAPKVQAQKVIAELESTGREVYTGAIGYASPQAGLELNVAIRTFEARAGRLWLGAGGGIVADSDPIAELEECLVKARPLVAAIGGSIEPVRVSPISPAPPALLGGRRRPDPALGVFETLLVLDGEPQNLAAHLARLECSLAEVYGLGLPPHLEARVRALAAGARMRLRIDVVPGGDAPLSLAPARPRALPIVLHPFTLPGGLGAHKWRDRALVDALTPTPLLLDADGTVLEAGWANVLIRRGEELLRPRADGRILPGTSLPPATEADLTLDDLRAADELLVSSSIAGTVPAVLASDRPAAPSSAPPERAAPPAAGRTS